MGRAFECLVFVMASILVLGEQLQHIGDGFGRRIPLKTDNEMFRCPCDGRDHENDKAAAEEM
jgi:hypothetical protein